MLVYQAKCYNKETKELLCWFTSPNLKEVTAYANSYKDKELFYVKIVDSSTLDLDGFK